MAPGIKNFRLGLKGKILLVVLCVFACFMALSSYFLINVYNTAVDKIKLARVEERTGIIGRSIQSHIQSVTDTMSLVAKFFPMLGKECFLNSSSVEQRFTEYLDEVCNAFLFFDSISVYDDKGTLLFGQKQFFSRNRMLKDVQWFHRVRYNGSITYGHPFVSKQYGFTQLPLGLGVEYEGKNYFICGLLALEKLTDDYLFQGNNLQQSAFLLNHNGVVLNATNAEYKGVRILQSQIEFMRLHDFGARKYISDSGKEWYYGFYGIPQADLFCVVFLYEDQFDSWRSELAGKANMIRGVASLFAVVCAMLLLFPVVRDLRLLTRNIKNISDKNFEDAYVDQRVLKRNDELGDFARNLDCMVRKMLDLLEKANESTRRKNKFIEKMGHEIRTPVNNISASSYLALQNCQDPLIKSYLTQIETTSQSLLKLLDNILDFSKYDIENCFSNEELFNLHEMLLSIKSLLKNKTLEKKLEYNLSINENIPKYIRSNKENIRRILLNLISNAIKFTQHGYVHIDIACEPYKNGIALMIEVLDSGVGIENKKLKKIFERASAYDGEHGLLNMNARGLLIVKTIVDIMGGEISIQSKVKKGTSVRVIIPIEKSVVEYNEDVLVLSESNETFLSVLLAEGDKSCLSAIQTLLEQANCKVFVAVNGDDAVRIAEENVLDMAFIDVEMPLMDGHGTVKRILSIPEQRNLVIIALASALSFEKKTKCFEEGMADCIDKEIEPEYFYKLLKVWAERIKGKE